LAIRAALTRDHGSAAHVMTVERTAATVSATKGRSIVASRQPNSNYAHRRQASEVAETVAAQKHENPDGSLLESTSFGLKTEQWNAFVAALDASPRDLPRLRRLLDEPSVFELPEF
jgi:hypothetical protein